MTQYTIRHTTRGDVGRFSSHTAAALVALELWPLEEWEIEPVE